MNCENVDNYADDLFYVRHQLDGLAFVRATSGLRRDDCSRYQELCEKELVLLAAARPFAHAS
jgi:hypothetical protein